MSDRSAELFAAMTARTAGSVSDLEMLKDALPGWSEAEVLDLIVKTLQAWQIKFPAMAQTYADNSAPFTTLLTLGVVIGSLSRERSIAGVKR